MGVRALWILACVAVYCPEFSRAQTESICYSLTSRAIGTTQYRSQTYSYTTACGIFNAFRCTRTRSRQQSYTVYSTQYMAQFGCCSGYTESGTNQCSDINECDTLTANDCEDGCINTPGSYMCSCDAVGYTLNTDGRSCRDIDECSFSTTNNCQHNCTNTVGSYNCSCNDGYVLNEDGYSCNATCDPDCENGGTCSAPDTCDCAEGYLGDTCAQAICDPDCENGGTCSAPNTCDCTEGYLGDTCVQATSPVIIVTETDGNLDQNFIGSNKTSSGGDILPYIIGGSAGGGLIILLLLVLVIIILAVSLYKSKEKSPRAQSPELKNINNNKPYANPVYFNSEFCTPYEVPNNNYRRVPKNEKPEPEHCDYEIMTTPENVYDEIGSCYEHLKFATTSEVKSGHDGAEFCKKTDTSVKNSPMDTTVKNSATDTPVKNSPTDTSVKNSPTDTSVKNSPTDTSVKNSPTDTSVKNSPTDTSVKNSPTDGTSLNQNGL